MKNIEYKKALVNYHLFSPSSETDAKKKANAIRRTHLAYIEGMMEESNMTREAATAISLKVRRKVLNAIEEIRNAD